LLILSVFDLISILTYCRQIQIKNSRLADFVAGHSAKRLFFGSRRRAFF